MLKIQDLHVRVDDKEILKGVSLDVDNGSVHALMGPNGSGKSTLAFALMGHPNCLISQGKIVFDGQDITQLSPDERSKLGIFLSFQYPKAIAGVSVSAFLRAAVNARRESPISVVDFMKLVREKMSFLGMSDEFLKRSLNDGFSGGEKKKMEILQLLLLDPKLAILDETDSGLDIDALKIVAKGVNAFRGSGKSILIITHYKRILDYIDPDIVSIMRSGKIVHQGNRKLVDELEEKGYGWIE